MRRESEKIPTIRKQYVQTIFDGLKTQFDETMKRQLSDQIDKVQTLQSVYQSSFQSQSSIIDFLTKLSQQKNKSHSGLFNEMSQKLDELEKEQCQERKSVILMDLSEKIKQANQVINILNVSLEELKEENFRIGEELEKEKQKNGELQKKLAEMLSVNQQNQQLKAQLAAFEAQNAHLKHEKQQKQRQLVNLQQQLQILAKFINYDEHQTLKIRKKISDREMLNKEQLYKLQQFASVESQKRQSLRQLHQSFDNLLSVDKNVILDRITEQEEEDHHSSSSIASKSEKMKKEAQCSQTEKQIKEQGSKKLLRSETAGKLNGSQPATGFSNIRQSQSDITESNQDNEDKVIEQQIMILKEELQKKMSDFEAVSRNSEPEPNKRVSKRTSVIIEKLQQSRSTTTLYYQKLQQENALLMKRLQSQKLHYTECINEQSEKIDELMTKLQELQEQRVRALNALELREAALMEKNSHVEILCAEVEKLREENAEFGELCLSGKAKLEMERRKSQNLEDQIRELNSQRHKTLQQKNKLESQLKYSNQLTDELKQTLSKKQHQLSTKNTQSQQSTSKYQQLYKKMSQYQETIIQLEGSLVSYQKCIDELEVKVQGKNQQERGYLDEIQRLKKIIEQLKGDVQGLEKEVLNKTEECSRALNTVKTLEKNIQDLKYMNNILKKDLMKVKQIEAQDWDKELEQVRTNSKGKNVLKISNDYTDILRPKVNSFTVGTTSTCQFKNHPGLIAQMSKQNISSYAPNKSKNKFQKEGTKKDSSFTSKNPRNLAKMYTEMEYLAQKSDRPITDIIRKKYMM